MPSDPIASVVDRAGLADVEALFNAVFSWKPVPSGFAAWRYASPEVSGLCVGVREPGSGKLIAAHGVQVLRTTSGALLGLSVDVMVHPEHQRRGLGALMEERVRGVAGQAGCAALICFPNPKLASLREKLGTWEPAVRARAHSVPAEKLVEPAPGYRVADAPPAGIQRFWQAAAQTGIDRTAAYLTWRFEKNPLNRYRWVLPEPSSGAAVTKVFVDPLTGQRSGDIVDLLVDTPASARAAIASACHQLRAEGVSKITLWAPPLASDALLASLGFEPDAALSRTLQVRYLATGPRIDFSRWFLTQADTDLY